MTSLNNRGSFSLGAKLSIVSAVITVVACAFYCANAGGANVFDAKVVAFLALAAACSVAYVLVANKFADVLNLVAAVLLAMGLVQVAINSIATFADVLTGITMFGSTGGIEWIVATLAMIAVAMIVEQVSCFMRRTA